MIAPLKRIGIRDLDRDRGLRPNVRNRRREQVGPLLVNEACAPALSAGLFVHGTCLLAPLDLATDRALADVHEELVHGRIRRQGKHVQPLDPIGSGIRELLGDIHARHVPGNLRADGRGNAKCLYCFRIGSSFQAKTA